MASYYLSQMSQVINIRKWEKVLMKRINKKRGPKPDILKIEGDWEKSVKKAINKVKPKDGWPEQGKK
jgi:hypothetical protein